ncbi:MAG: glycosyltransferase, partial [Muribaculaceae bacterium]|nr:glycosyltransferase [Muribaculaceae bacterium]
NGIALEAVSEAKPDESLRMPDETRRKVVIMVSAFRAQKDQPTLIRAMQHLPDDYRLWLAGDGIAREKCEMLAAKLNLSERVRFLGVRDDVPALMASADVVVLSSHYEGMSLASIEGMAAGKPFIASDVEGLREVAGGAALLFPHGDHRQLAELIRRVCEDDSLRTEVVAGCRERAMQYDIGHTVDGYERIYTKLVNRNK